MSYLVLEETLKYHAGHLATDPSSVDIFCEKVYGGERRWLAGCLLLTGGADPTFQLRPLNVFFTEKPDEEVGIVSIIKELHNNSFPPRCQICVWRLLDSLRRVSFVSLHPQIVGSLHPSYLFLGPEWDGQCVKDHRSRILPVKFGKTDSNSPDYCINKCKSHEYSYAGVEYSKVIILKM